VRCSNGWQAWVDARALVTTSRTTVGAGPLNPVALLAVGLLALLVVAGSLLAWFSVGPQSLDAWDIELITLFTHDDGAIDLKTGPVLLVLALAAVVLVVVRLPRKASAVAFLVLGGVVAVLALAGVLLLLDLPDPRPDLGIGLVLTAVAGLGLATVGVLVPAAKPRG
jgi:hypothetical protein